MLTAYSRKWNDFPFFCQWESTVRRALDLVPLVDGLAFNNPATPNARYCVSAAPCNRIITPQPVSGLKTALFYLGGS
jgi:hypothetical protein